MRRRDLQGLRGLAISAVVLFDFFPGYFPNGYLGIDQFFVLTGFLMTMMFYESSPSDSFESFYYRRVKRIIPMYLPVALLISFAVLYVTFPSIYAFATGNVIDSTALITNIQKSFGANPEQANQADNMFAHFWYLSVELQYYLVMPFIMAIIKWTPPNLNIMCFFLLGSLSLTFYCMVDNNSSINNVFARIWQFSVGSVSYLESGLRSQAKERDVEKARLLDDEDTNDELKSYLKETVFNLNQSQSRKIVQSVIVTGLFLSFLDWNTLDRTYLRVVTTLFAGIALTIGTTAQSPLLTNSSIVYLGNISYALYLVHWPVYFGIKTYTSTNFTARLFGVILSVLITVFLTRITEKWYSDASTKIVGLLVIIILIINALLLSFSVFLLHDNIVDNEKAQTVKPDHIATTQSTHPGVEKVHQLTKQEQDAWKLNNYYYKADYKLLENAYCEYAQKKPFGLCNIKSGLNSESTNVGMMIGNSYAANLGDLVVENCGSHMKILKQNSLPVCEPLILTHYKNTKCEGVFMNFLKFVQENPPDYLFLIARWLDLAKVFKGTLDDDPYYKQADQRMNEFVKIVKKKIIILHGNPAPSDGFLPEFNKRVGRLGVNARSDDLVSTEYIATESRRRLEALVKKYPNTILIDLQTPLTFNSTYKFTDDSTAISYYTGGAHYSPHSENLISKAFKEACDKL